MCARGSSSATCRRASSGSARGQSAGQWVVVAIALVVFAAFAWGLRYLAAGRAVYATGSDPEAARLAGIRPRWVVFGVFVVMGALAGLAALLERRPLPRRRSQRRRGPRAPGDRRGGRGRRGGLRRPRHPLRARLIGVALLGSIGAGPGLPPSKPQWEKAIQGLIILLAVASDA